MRLAVPEREVWVTGLGFVAPGSAGGREAAATLRSRLLAACQPPPAGAERLATDFDVPALLGPKGLRHLGRGTLYLMSAALLALRDAGLGREGLEEAGVAAGTATASAAVVADFDRTTLAEGPQAPNPALFPQTVWNGPASQVSIRHGLRGPNLTVSSNLNSGLDAILAAARAIALGGARVFLAGGFEELSPYFRVILPGGTLERAPVAVCEGSALLVLEDAGAASARGARPLAQIRSWGSGWSPAGAGCADTPSGGTGGTTPCGTPVSLTWRHEIPDAAGAQQDAPDAIALVGRLGCGGGFTSALAALLAAAPGAAAGRVMRACELVTAADGRGRTSSLLLERGG